MEIFSSGSNCSASAAAKPSVSTVGVSASMSPCNCGRCWAKPAARVRADQMNIPEFQ